MDPALDTTPPLADGVPGLTQAPFSATTRRRGSYSRRPYDTLGIAWLHGTFHAAVFRRQVLKRSWPCPYPVRTVEEFESALDDALVTLRFGGSEISLILEHDEFVHQAEQAPAFSEAASRSYLRARVERYEQEHGPVLWISQRTVSARKEATFLLHLLPSAFYGKINGLLLARRLDLTRIVPLVVPLQLTLESLAGKADKPILIAAETGDATTVMVAQPGGEMLFARTMLARWESDPSRIGVEVNRSVLYAKQQFGTIIETIWLLGSAGEAARAEVQARCGSGKEITVRPSTPDDWMHAVAGLTARHPINLVAGYLGRKRRQQFIRRAVIGACWLTFIMLGLDTWTRAVDWRAEHSELQRLQANRSTLAEQRERLRARNTEVQQQREFIRQASDDRLPNVPARFLAYVAGVLPSDAHLSDFSIRWDPTAAKWIFRIDGQIDTDEDSARELLGAFQRQVAHSPLHVHFNDAARTISPISGSGLDSPTSQRFGLEGILFE